MRALGLMLLLVMLGASQACQRPQPGVTVLSYASPYSPSHPFSRADQVWIDCTNGDRFKTGKTTPDGKPDPNTVTVSLTAGKAGVAGAFRLVGKVKDEPALTRTAHAPLPEFEDTTPDLWMTVSDTPVSNPPKKKKR